VNAVSAVRRVAALLQLLGLPAAALHAQQQQRQRLKALDRCVCGGGPALCAVFCGVCGLAVKGGGRCVQEGYCPCTLCGLGQVSLTSCVGF
jgi:hypothetical protein